jgi:N-acetylmuramoyl-L-alanine amidase
VKGAAVLLPLLVALAAAGCTESAGDATLAPVAPSTSAPVTTTTAIPTTTSTTLVAPIPDGPPRALVTATGVVAAVTETRADGSYTVVSPCGKDVRVGAGTPIPGAHVVIDPGHGGEEPGAVGPDGLRESDLNLAVAIRVRDALEAQGIRAVLTRTGNYRITLASRAAIATGLEADAFVSIHHNAAPDHQQDEPGTEVYYQSTGGESARRLGGLVYEETFGALSAYDISWGWYQDAQVKVRLGNDGGDYYGILRRTAGVPGVLAELAYITNPAEEALLATPEFQQVEADAVARGIVRFLTTDDPGTGYVGPSRRTAPAGPGGGADGCVDPPLE